MVPQVKINKNEQQDTTESPIFNKTRIEYISLIFIASIVSFQRIYFGNLWLVFTTFLN